MDADKNSAIISIDILLLNTMLQHQYFEIFINFTKQFNKQLGNGWVMDKNYINENQQQVSKIFIKLTGVNIYNQNDWPTIISFLKKYIIALDAFWDEYKPAFETL